MKLHPSKALLKELDTFEISLYNAGYFPEVNYHHEENCTSFNLFEKMEVSKLLFKCLHFNMTKAGIEYGAFSRKHGDKFIQLIKREIIQGMTPIKSDWMKSVGCQGKLVKLWGIEDRYNFREGRIVEKIYMDDVIFDFECWETNGYFAETGSAHIWEIAMIEDAIWRPFHLSQEEKKLMKESY